MVECHQSGAGDSRPSVTASSYFVTVLATLAVTLAIHCAIRKYNKNISSVIIYVCSYFFSLFLAFPSLWKGGEIGGAESVDARLGASKHPPWAASEDAASAVAPAVNSV